MKTIRFKLYALNAPAVHGAELNIAASEIISFGPAFETVAEGQPPVAVENATLLTYSAGQALVQESSRTIRGALKKLSEEATEDEA